jgi:hypothetical protein
MNLEETERLKIFKKFDADDAQAQELLRYSRSGVTGQCNHGALFIPLVFRKLAYPH